MRNPPPEDERALHERVLQHDPVAPTDVFKTYMELIEKVLRKMGVDEDAAHDSAVEVIWSYLDTPGRYDPGKKVSLFTYLKRAAIHRVVDKRRSADARARRTHEFVRSVEQGARTPNEVMEASVRSREAVDQLEKGNYLTERDRAALRLILAGEVSTEEIAKALGLPPKPLAELRREVKRHKDRLMKLLERFGKEDSDDES
ncbi:sigma-70 family RNA polymerase sigma factor [Archangium violaceum]|uniref:RNA polymerase sigma factor n=1 Tax=Archangium violaceum TaxID=83451 RepID=UPI00194F0AC5|nr:sigma-70 family RNA polymerase sigma factor [Archangium violaceum]QRN97338.1 sigma-70 family RNA polymerase sigma factor [Archangium violaceum]